MRYILLLIFLIAVTIFVELGLVLDEMKIETLDTISKDSNITTKSIDTNQTISKGIESKIDREPTIYEQLSTLGASIGDPVFIRIFKLTAELELWIKVGDRYQLLHNYTICRQSGYLGPKLKEGDLQGPEGFYYASKARLNPNSKFHLSFNIGYPNKYDRIHHRTGSALMIHGDCVSVGCFAMTDEKIEEIYELVEKSLYGTEKIVRVHIFPFRMTDKNMLYYRDRKWYKFWQNLKEGYDYFEENGIPPNVDVVDGRYTFGDIEL
jgi:murein L,D-transpeptidase YafK